MILMREIMIEIGHKQAAGRRTHFVRVSSIHMEKAMILNEETTKGT